LDQTLSEMYQVISVLLPVRTIVASVAVTIVGTGIGVGLDRGAYCIRSYMERKRKAKEIENYGYDEKSIKI
jgi:hypothetical protein